MKHEPPTERIDLLRILDANANRAAEGLRAVEEYLRFVLDDRHLTQLCKELRHELSTTVADLWTEARRAARETQRDVGTEITTQQEYQRDDARGVLTANFQRALQSLRCLEEYCKPLDVKIAQKLEALRYRAYTLQRALEVTLTSCQRLAEAKLYVLIDGCSTPQSFEQTAQTLVAAGVNVLQLRDKKLSDRSLLERARLLREITKGASTLLIINDRPDLALLADVDGVHVGQDELSVKDARRVVGPDRLVGVSTHSLDQARLAVLDGADYLGVGPTFPSPTKQFDEYPGLPLLREVADEIRLPAFAIGGVTPENLPQVLATGFYRVAIGSAVVDDADPVVAVAEFLKTLHVRT